METVQLEKQVRDSERRASETAEQNRELRRMLDRQQKELSTTRLHADRLTDKLRSENSARQSVEQHARHLEYTFESSGKGVALLKAAKCDKELDKAREESRVLAEELGAKVVCVLRCRDTAIRPWLRLHKLGRSARSI
ncbi:unnamed protein product [Ostreobium quekettii]|uniref:Uncharacterized protein n=1 Tax=Ostreobium quekettii TaxID=121088 RepID=A0A8S1IZC2_9CHLO|nr:unnamed protein product [Ostreobium quekettii]